MADVTRWLIVGPYPPEQGSGPAAAAAFVAERLAAGDSVHAVSPRPTAAHEHLPLEGLRGIRAIWRLARAHGADGLWLRVEAGIVLRAGIDRRQALMERAALALLLRRFATSVLDVGDVGLLPGGRAGRPVFASATRFVTHGAAATAALVASGAPADKVSQVDLIDGLPASGSVEPIAPAATVHYPEPSLLRDLGDTRNEIESAVRARAEQLQATRAAANPPAP